MGNHRETSTHRLLRIASRRWQYAVAAVVVVVGVALSAAFFVYLRDQEYRHVHDDFVRACEDRIQSLRKTLELDFLELRSVQSFFHGIEEEMTSKEFATFVSPLLGQHASIRAVEWAPRMPAALRTKYESGAVREGLPDFTILERGHNGNLIHAPARREYFPVFYVEPGAGNVAPLGYNLAAIPSCREAMDQACDADRLAMTSKIQPLHETGGVHDSLSGIRLFLPVYKKNTPTATVDQRRRNLRGFVVEVLDLKGLADESFTTLTPVGIGVRMTDCTTPNQREMLYYHRTRLSPHKGSDVVRRTWVPKRDDFSFSKTLDVADRRWTVTCLASAPFVAARITWYAWDGAVFGLLLTGGLASYLVTLANRNIRLSELLTQLDDANRSLKREIAGRKTTEEILRDKRRELLALLDQSFQFIGIIAPDGTLRQVNQVALRLVDAEESDVIGKPFWEAPWFRHSPIIQDRVRDSVLAAAGGNAVRLEVPSLSARGHIHWIDTSIKPVRDESGKVVFLVPEGHDVTERKRMEDDLRRARDAAEAATVAKSQFLANMSHEIRTPMTSILGYADLLMDPKLDRRDRENYVAVIRRSGEHLLALINDILDLSKIEARKLSLALRPCNVVAILADVASVLRPHAEQQGISFTIEYPTPLPETILTDGGRLRQAIVNLAGNAVKFTKHGGVRIVASFLPRWRDDESAVRIEIIDTGIGIREEIVPQLFQPFFQGEHAVSQRFGGTGLGLAISHQIAELLGGELRVESAWGSGSAFTLTIPTGNLDGVAMLEHPSETELAIAHRRWKEPTTDLHDARILLAEDGYDNRQLIETILRAAGAEVESVEDGRQAVERAEAGDFDVILMDMNMPEMDGIEATRLLRDRGYDRPILALTANAMTGDAERSKAAGCDEHIAKPIDRARLIETIASFVHERAGGFRQPV